MARLLTLGGLFASTGVTGQAVPSQDGAKSPDIVVKGRRESPLLDGGEWTVSLSRPYGRSSAESGEDRSDAPLERTWRFCLKRVPVESLIRVLVGEGRTDTRSSPAYCKPMRIALGDGRVRASQRCSGGRIRSYSPDRMQPDPDRMQPDMVPMWATISTSGRYTPVTLKLDFTSSREPDVAEPGQRTIPELTRWSIEGERLDACRTPPRPRP